MSFSLRSDLATDHQRQSVRIGHSWVSGSHFGFAETIAASVASVSIVVLSPANNASLRDPNQRRLTTDPDVVGHRAVPDEHDRAGVAGDLAGNVAAIGQEVRGRAWRRGRFLST
jgi:hypothetical protein